jgi:hypothetical protein
MTQPNPNETPSLIDKLLAFSATLANEEAELVENAVKAIREMRAEVKSLRNRKVEKAYDALCQWVCHIANSGSIDWADVHRFHSIIHPDHFDRKAKNNERQRI